MHTRASISLAILLLISSCAPSDHPTSTWEPLPDLYARNLQALLANDPNGDGLVAMLTEGTIFRSTDAGLSWFRAGSLPPACRPQSLLQHPDAGSTFFASTTHGLFRSTDSGTTWERIVLPLSGDTSQACRAVAIDLWNSNRIYVGTDGHGLLVSADGGISWRHTGDTLLRQSSVTDIQVATTRPDIVYATGIPFGIVRSTDGGSSWTTLGKEIQSVGATCTHICVHPSDDQVVLICTDAGSIFKSTNGGGTWSPTRKGRTWGSVHSLAASRVNGNIVLAGTETEVLLSTDFGGTWNGVSRSLPPTAVSVTIPPRGPIAEFFAWGPGIGLMKTIDGGETWKTSDDGLGSATVDIVKTDHSGQFVFAAIGMALLRFDAANSSWQFAGTGLLGLPPTSITMPRHLEPLAFTTTRAGVFQNAGSGLGWSQSFPGLRVIPVLVEPHPWLETRLFASSDRGLHVSTNNGVTWADVKPSGRNFHVAQLLFHPKNAGVLFGAANKQGIIRSTDGGLTWLETKSMYNTAPIVALSQGDHDAQTVFAWSERGECIRSRDGGIAWDPFAQPWSTQDTILLAIDRENPADLVVLINGAKLLHSSSGGTGWTAVSNAKLPASPRCLDWNLRTRTVIVGTRGKGVWRMRI